MVLGRPRPERRGDRVPGALAAPPTAGPLNEQRSLGSPSRLPTHAIRHGTVITLRVFYRQLFDRGVA